MKKILVGVSSILVLIIVIYSATNMQNDKQQNYPWQISIMQDGKSKVFEVILTETTLEQVSQILNNQPKLAIFEQNNKITLEAYYKNITRGGLSGDFIFTIDATNEQLNKLKHISRIKSHLTNNGLQYELNKNSVDSIADWKVKFLSYIPLAQLDESIILKRFGPAYKKIESKIKIDDGKSTANWHYLYPEKGLDIILNKDGNEILQYVTPKNFNLLLEPLQPH